MKHAKYTIALGLIAGSVSIYAQSNVSIYGIVDVSVQRTIVGGVGSVNSLSSGGLNASRFGFRGVEDLGGGLKAGFTLESSLAVDTGTGGRTNTNNQASGVVSTGSLLFDRLAYVNLSTNTLGEVRLGHDFVPSHYNTVSFDAMSTNGVGKILNFTSVGVGNVPLYTNIIVSNSVGYYLPKNLGGFYGSAMAAFGENSSTAANPHDGNVYGLRFGWANGPIDIGLASTRTRYVSTALIGDMLHSNIGASYDAGFVKLFSLFNVTTVKLAGGQVDKRTAEIGAHVPTGNYGRFRVSYAQLQDKSDSSLKNADGSNRNNNDAKQFAVGYVYDFSKRTAVYTTIARIKNNGQANYFVASSPAPALGRNSTGMEVGLRHSF